MTYKERIAIAVPNPDANEKTIFNDATDGLLKTKDSSGVVETLATTEGIAAAEPKVYVALLTQTGTNAPVATVLKNTLGGVPVWSYVSAGVYRLTLASAFTANKTNVEKPVVVWSAASVGDDAYYRLTKISTSIIELVYTFNGVETDGELNKDFIKIEVYP